MKGLLPCENMLLEIALPQRGGLSQPSNFGKSLYVTGRYSPAGGYICPTKRFFGPIIRIQCPWKNGGFKEWGVNPTRCRGQPAIGVRGSLLHFPNRSCSWAATLCWPAGAGQCGWIFILLVPNWLLVTLKQYRCLERDRVPRATSLSIAPINWETIWSQRHQTPQSVAALLVINVGQAGLVI
jgi:hypothetical protein